MIGYGFGAVAFDGGTGEAIRRQEVESSASIVRLTSHVGCPGQDRSGPQALRKCWL